MTKSIKKSKPVVVYGYHDGRYYLLKCPRRVALYAVYSYRGASRLVIDVLRLGCDLKIVNYEECPENIGITLSLESCPF